MIEGFEEYTYELNEEEEKVMPYLRNILRRHRGSDQAATAGALSGELQVICRTDPISGPRMRKMIHNIRVACDVEGLVASSRGYYIASSKEEIERYAESLRERAAAILAVRRSLLTKREPGEQMLLGI